MVVNMKQKTDNQNLYLRILCLAMAIIDFVVGIQHLYDKDSNALFKTGMAFFWLFGALKGLNLWIDRIGWIIWIAFFLLQVWWCTDDEFLKNLYFER